MLMTIFMEAQESSLSLPPHLSIHTRPHIIINIIVVLVSREARTSALFLSPLPDTDIEKFVLISHTSPKGVGER